MLKLLCSLLLPASLLAQAAHYRMSEPVALNDLNVTPGTVRQVTKDDLCPRAHTRKIRHVTKAMKIQVCGFYGVFPEMCNGKNYEIDHLVALEDGGNNSLLNLWPQPIKQARIKDRLENRVHKEICKGRMTVVQAKECLALDWWECAQHLGIN